jgi:Papain-like cysteine protease AvrRpt2
MPALRSTPLLDGLRITLPIEMAVEEEAPQRLARPTLLPCVPVSQYRSLWCWAAVAEMVARTFDNGSSWRQCTIANQLLGRGDCCHPPGDDHLCNCTSDLAPALNKVGRKVTEAAPTFDTVRTAIDQRRLVGVRIAWQSGGAHFLLIHGYEPSASGYSVVVADPALPDIPVPVSALESGNYAAMRGRWTDLYITAGRLP